MFHNILESVGLSDKEAAVYDALLEGGTMGVAELRRKAPGITRSNLYALLYSLRQKGLVSESEKKGKKVFAPAEPHKLAEYADTQLLKLKGAREQLAATMPDMSSKWNLAAGKPGVQFLEGRIGLLAILDDALTAKGEILQYIDSDTVERYFTEEDAAHSKKRHERGIKKRIISTESAKLWGHAHAMDPALTKIHVLASDTAPFATSMLIYDGKISYLTLRPDNIIGVIIHDAAIYEMHRVLFEELWAKTEAITSSSAYASA